MAATSPWTQPQTKSPHWSEDSSVLYARALRRGEQGEAAFERDGALTLREDVLDKREESNHAF
jgi:hypothetical protein